MVPAIWCLAYSLREAAPSPPQRPPHGRPSDETLLSGLVHSVERFVQIATRDRANAQDNVRTDLKTQDGSGVMTYQLEQNTALSQALEERKRFAEDMLEMAAAEFGRLTGTRYQTNRRSIVQKKTATASALLDHDLLDAQADWDRQGKLPEGFRVASAGDKNGTDVGLGYATLDKVRAEHPDMILLYSGYAKGDDRIATRWAKSRNVTTVVFPMDFKKHGRRAGFERNRQPMKARP